MSVTFSNASFALVGGLTGATACAFPSELLDWTSADVIELARPLFLPKHGGAMGVIELVELPESPVQYQLDEIKRKSGLTWGQLADAMGVDARAVHLWRRGGGISAAHEERLQEMNALINSIDLGVPADVRAELVEAAPGGSLLERLRAGDFPRPLIAASPWRSRARAEVDRNVAERENDGIVDEDYVFLLYLESDAVRAFAAGGAELLDDPGATRRAWESLIDAQFAGMRQPEPIPVEAAEEVARRPQMTRVESSPSSAPPTSASLSGSGRSRLAGRSTRAGEQLDVPSAGARGPPALR